MIYAHDTFALTAEQAAHLATLSPACREHELSLLIYAHIYNERCRANHCALLSSSAEAALRDHWQAHREEYVARAITAAFPVETLRRVA